MKMSTLLDKLTDGLEINQSASVKFSIYQQLQMSFPRTAYVIDPGTYELRRIELYLFLQQFKKEGEGIDNKFILILKCVSEEERKEILKEYSKACQLRRDLRFRANSIIEELEREVS